MRRRSCELPPGAGSRAGTLTNTGRLPWDSEATPPILLSYHWRPTRATASSAFEGDRTPFASTGRAGLDDRPSTRGCARPRSRAGTGSNGTSSRKAACGSAPSPGASPRRWSPAMRDGDARRRADATPVRPTVCPAGRFALWRAAARMFAAHPLARRRPGQLPPGLRSVRRSARRPTRAPTATTCISRVLPAAGCSSAGLCLCAVRASPPRLARLARGQPAAADTQRRPLRSASPRPGSPSRCMPPSTRFSASRRPTCCSR